MKTIKINTYDYIELNKQGKLYVLSCLYEVPIDYANDFDEQGIKIKEDKYFSDFNFSENEINDHCKVNGYLFSIYGNPVHKLEINK